jgi:hypothetical protein
MQDAIVSRGELQQQQEQAILFPMMQQEAQQKTELGAINLQQAKIALQKQQQYVAAMKAHTQAIASGQPGASPMDIMDQIASDAAAHAQMAAKIGLPEEAREYATTASTIQRNQLEMATQKASLRQKMMSDLGNGLSASVDAKSFDQQKLIFQTQHPEAMQDPGVKQIMSLPYSPELVQRLQASVTTAQERAAIAAEKSRAQMQAADIRYKGILADTAEIDLRHARELDTATRKQGGDGTSGQVGMLLKGVPLTQVMPGQGKEAVRMRSLLQQQALDQLQRENPGMTAEEAGDELGVRQINYRAATHATSQLATSSAAINRSSIKIEKDMASMGEALQKMGTGDEPAFVGRVFSSIKTNLKPGGDKASTEFGGWLLEVAGEYAKLASGSYGAAGAPITEMQHALDLMQKAYTSGGYEGLHDFVTKASANARSAAQQATREAATGRPSAPVATPVAPVKISGDADFAKLPSGAEYIGPDGVRRRKR